MTNIIQLIKKLRKLTSSSILECKKALDATNNNIDDSIKWLHQKNKLKAVNINNKVLKEGLIGINFNNTKAIIFEMNCETDFVARNEKFINLMNLINQLLLINPVTTISDVLSIKLNNNQLLKDYIIDLIAIIGENIVLNRFFQFNKKNNQIFGLYLHSNKKIGSIVLFKGFINNKFAKQVAMHIAAMKPKFLSRDNVDANFLYSIKEMLKLEIKNNSQNIKKSDNEIEYLVNVNLNKKISEFCLLEQQFIFNEHIKIKKFIENQQSEIIDFIRYEVGELN